jgi:hypothetical protein
MNAKVTTYWMFGKPIVQEMPEDEVDLYLKIAREAGTLKGYIVDAVPAEIQPRAPLPFSSGDAVVTGGGRDAVFIGTDPDYPEQCVVRLTGFRADYVLTSLEGLRSA